jgi:hypothetical protein
LLRSFCYKLAVATTALNFEHINFIAHIFVYCCPFSLHSFSTLGWHLTQLTFLVSGFFLNLTSLLSIFCVCHILTYETFFPCPNPNSPCYFVPLLPYSGYHFLLFLGQVPYKTLPAFSNPSTTRDNLTHPVTAAATTQVKLCPYDEDKLHIWFHLIEAQFAAAGIRSQKLKYTNALASLPKQVFGTF